MLDKYKKVYDYISSGDRRTNLWKNLSSHYENLCVKDGNKFMETRSAKEFANKELHEVVPATSCNIILAIIERKEFGVDCTESESSEIKQWLRELKMVGEQWIVGKIQTLFPQEYDEYLLSQEN